MKSFKLPRKVKKLLISFNRGTIRGNRLYRTYIRHETKYISVYGISPWDDGAIRLK